MLFRRISQHIGSQNWLAVCLDLAIVVIGIFLGLQVSAWNDTRHDRQREAETLNHLRADFEEIKTEVDEALDFHRGIIVALNTVLLSTETGTITQKDNDSIRRGLQSALWYSTGAQRSGTYVDLVSSGQMHLIQNEELRSLLTKYDELHEKANLLFSQFWAGQRSHEIVFGRHFSYETVRRKNGEMFLPGEITAFDVVGMAADPEFRQAANRLIEYQVYYQIWHAKMANIANEVLSQL